jgi:hypothetical protein
MHRVGDVNLIIVNVVWLLLVMAPFCQLSLALIAGFGAH